MRAQVVSLGDSRSYFLATARNDCGVVYAKSTSGKHRSWRPSISDWCTVFRLAYPLRGLAVQLAAASLLSVGATSCSWHLTHGVPIHCTA